MVGVFVLMLDGCLYRDPYVDLGSGYDVGAISPGSPCILQYSSYLDTRTYSGWIAMCYTQEETGATSPRYAIVNELGDGTVLEFDSIEEWNQARREKRAEPYFPSVLVSDITGIKVDGDYVIGEHQDGHFLLDIRSNSIETWSSEKDWAEAVRIRTEMTPDGLINPKSRFIQSRDVIAYIIYIGIFAITLPWVLSPLRTRSKDASIPAGDASIRR